MGSVRPFRNASTTAIVFLAGALLAGTFQHAEARSPTVLSECGHALKSGSYVVDRDLTVEKARKKKSRRYGSGKKSRRSKTQDCFVVVEDFVTIDLGGFTLTGNGKGSGITDGGDGNEGIVVRNGGITGFAVGINLNLSPAARISGVTVTRNVGSASTFECNAPDALMHLSGIATGSGGMITDSTVRGNTGVGIKAGSGSRVTGNVAIDNTQAGYCVFSSSTVSGNTARRNDLDGVRTGSGSTVSGNTARQNGRDGFVANSGSNVMGNTAKDNDAAGLSVHCPSLVKGNAAIDNGENLVLNTDGGHCLEADNLTGG